MAPFIIGTPAEYEAARGRISALLEIPRMAPEQAELMH